MDVLFPKHLPVNENNWISNFLPKIQSLLNISNDDEEVLRLLISKDISAGKLDYNTILRKGTTICLAAGPSLQDFNLTLLKEVRNECNLVAADGASRWLFENEVQPDLIVSDLDGLSIENIRSTVANDIPIQILCHGDNFRRLQHAYPVISRGKFELVTQGRSIENWQCSLGFTDGDRAVSLASRYSETSYLYGYDLIDSQIGKYSKPHFSTHQTMTDRKRKKLKIAWEVISWYHTKKPVYTSNAKKSPGIEYSFLEFVKQFQHLTSK